MAAGRAYVGRGGDWSTLVNGGIIHSLASKLKERRNYGNSSGAP